MEYKSFSKRSALKGIVAKRLEMSPFFLYMLVKHDICSGLKTV